MNAYECADPVCAPIPFRPVRVLSSDIKFAVCRQFRVTQNDLVSQRRSRHVARPRQIAMYLTKRFTRQSLPEIGRRFGDRDHTTVIHAIKTIKRLRAEDPDLDEQIAWVEAELIAA